MAHALMPVWEAAARFGLKQEPLALSTLSWGPCDTLYMHTALQCTAQLACAQPPTLCCLKHASSHTLLGAPRACPARHAMHVCTQVRQQATHAPCTPPCPPMVIAAPLHLTLNSCGPSAGRPLMCAAQPRHGRTQHPGALAEQRAAACAAALPQ